MRMLFADGLPDTAVERLRAGGCAPKPSPTAGDPPARAAGFAVLVAGRAASVLDS